MEVEVEREIGLTRRDRKGGTPVHMNAIRSLLSEVGGSSCGRLWCCSCRVLCGVVLVVCLCV